MGYIEKGVKYKLNNLHWLKVLGPKETYNIKSLEHNLLIIVKDLWDLKNQLIWLISHTCINV